jgi:pantetheine-phosphate adenylyltransferase
MWRPSFGRGFWRTLPAGMTLRRLSGAFGNGTDFDAEYQMACINNGICPELDTLLLPAAPEYQHFSSSMAREMIRYHQPLERYLPAAILPLIRKMEKEGNENGNCKQR